MILFSIFNRFDQAALFRQCFNHSPALHANVRVERGIAVLRLREGPDLSLAVQRSARVQDFHPNAFRKRRGSSFRHDPSHLLAVVSDFPLDHFIESIFARSAVPQPFFHRRSISGVHHIASGGVGLRSSRILVQSTNNPDQDT
jgi:hypothetical protein